MPAMHHRTTLNILVAMVWIGGFAVCAYLTVRDGVFVGVFVFLLGLLAVIQRERLSEGEVSGEGCK